MTARLHCAHSGARPAIDARNNRFFWCEECQGRVTTAITGHKGWALPADHPSIRDLAPEQFLRLADTIVRACDACCTVAHCELHHFAPQALFKAEAHRWPTGYLCKSCHATWHRMVTPYLPGSFDPQALAAFLVDRLGWEKLDRVAHALRAMKQRRAA